VVFILVLLRLARDGRAASRRGQYSPTNLLQPARLRLWRPFRYRHEESACIRPHALLVATTVNALGQAVTYEIIAGRKPYDRPPTRCGPYVFGFRPQMSFGRLLRRRVVLSFSTSRFKG